VTVTMFVGAQWWMWWMVALWCDGMWWSSRSEWLFVCCSVAEQQPTTKCGGIWDDGNGGDSRREEQCSRVWNKDEQCWVH